MLADHADKIGLNFPPPAPETANKLKELLPSIATVSNPLDYTTPIWGDMERLPPVLAAVLGDPYAAAIMVQDYPLPELNEGKQPYLNDAMSFAEATRTAEIPAIVCSTLPENIDLETREQLIENGVVPMQGIPETLIGVRDAVWYGAQRKKILSGEISGWTPTNRYPIKEECWTLVDEWQGKQFLQSAGLRVPQGRLATAQDAPDCADSLGYPVVVKMLNNRIAHKTELGGVALELNNRREVQEAIRQIQDAVSGSDAGIAPGAFLIERQVEAPVAELLVSIRNDAQFGLAMTLASGGVLTELIGDAVTLLLPVTDSELGESLSQLKLSRLLSGYRGRPDVHHDVVIEALQKLTVYTQAHAVEMGEIEINPLFIMVDGVYAVDVLIRCAPKV